MESGHTFLRFFLSEPFPNSPLKALEDKKQGWNYAEVLHLEAGLQDKSLQSQQVARNFALPTSASAGGWGCRTGQRPDQSLPPTTAAELELLTNNLPVSLPALPARGE